MDIDEGLRDRDDSAPEAVADVDAKDDENGENGEKDAAPAAAPSWWHRDHPTFSALTGFFTGLAVVIVVPGAFAAVLRALFDYDTAEELFPFVLIVLAVPLVLIAIPRTRRFGRYMLLGMLATAIVVLGVAALVVWILIKTDG
jgi:4-amino-4-deoxy-L-arabinose transferase-like glycosyltransferase